MLHRCISAACGIGITSLYGAGGYFAAEAAINENSYLSLGLVMAAVSAVALAAWHIRGAIEKSRSEMRETRSEMKELCHKLDSLEKWAHGETADGYPVRKKL